MLTLDSVIQPAPGIVTRESEGELVIVLPAQGKYLVLNGTGVAIFRQLDGKTPLQVIAIALSQNFQVPLETTQADVLALIAQLLARGVVLASEA